MLLLTCVFALAVPAATAAPTGSPAFHVTIHATNDVTIYHADGSHPNCGSTETRHVEIHNEAPLTLTANQLGKAQNYLFKLVAIETRSVVAGSCSYGSPAVEVKACGKVTYKIGSGGTLVGFEGKKDKFFFAYSYIGSDPYHGGCGEGAAAQPGGGARAWIDNFPAYFLKNTLTVVSRAKLDAGKRFVVRWSGAGQAPPNNCGTPPCVIYNVQGTSSWQVTLVPVS